MMQGTREKKMQRPRKQEPRPVGIEDSTVNKYIGGGVGMPPVYSKEGQWWSHCYCVFPCACPRYFGRYCSQPLPLLPSGQRRKTSGEKRLESRKLAIKNRKALEMHAARCRCQPPSGKTANIGGRQRPNCRQGGARRTWRIETP